MKRSVMIMVWLMHLLVASGQLIFTGKDTRTFIDYNKSLFGIETFNSEQQGFIKQGKGRQTTGNKSAGNENKGDKKNKLRIGISFTPAVTYRHLRFDPKQSFVADARNQAETSKFGFAAGLLVQRPVAARSAIALGLYFYDIGFRTKNIPLTWRPPNPSFPQFFKSTVSYQYIRLAAQYRYLIWDGTISFNIAPGIAADVLISRRTTVYAVYANGNTGKNASGTRGGYRPVVLSAGVTIGAEYDVSKRMAIRFEPSYYFGLTSAIQGKEGKEILYAFGANAVFLFSLRK